MHHGLFEDPSTCDWYGPLWNVCYLVGCVHASELVGVIADQLDFLRQWMGAFLSKLKATLAKDITNMSLYASRPTWPSFPCHLQLLYMHLPRAWLQHRAGLHQAEEGQPLFSLDAVMIVWIDGFLMPTFASRGSIIAMIDGCPVLTQASSVGLFFCACLPIHVAVASKGGAELPIFGVYFVPPTIGGGVVCICLMLYLWAVGCSLRVRAVLALPVSKCMGSCCGRIPAGSI
jgi:hypothetical protein